MSRRGDGCSGYAQEASAIRPSQALPGSLSSQVCVAPFALHGLQSRVSDSAMIDKPEPPRFPPPWTVIEENAACFIVRDASRHALSYVYFEEEPGRRSAEMVRCYIRESSLSASNPARWSVCDGACLRPRRMTVGSQSLK